MQPRVLVIEDHPINLELMTYILHSVGYSVSTAQSGKEGLAKAHSDMPDLIVSDIEMPEVDGFEVANRLKSDDTTRKIPLLAVTGMAIVGAREKVMAAGFDSYLAKPFHPQELLETVKSFIAKRNAQASEVGSPPKDDRSK